jgi:diguanylate cyclase (GGDEF)-like protein
MALPSDPSQFLLSLNARLNIAGTKRDLMISILEALEDIPEIAASWVSAAREDGSIIPVIWRGAEPPAQPVSGHLNSPCRRAILFGEITVIDDWRTETKTYPELCGAVAGTGWRAAAAIPIIGLDELNIAATGTSAPAATALVLQSSQPHFFSKAWPRAAIAHLATAIDAGLQSCQNRLALRRAQAIQQLFLHGADLLLTATSESAILDRLCDRLVDSGVFLSATIGQMTPQKIWNHRSAAARFNVNTLRVAGSRHREGELRPPLNMLAWQAEKTLISNRYTSDPRFTTLTEVASKIGMKAVAGFVIRRQGERWAVLGLSSDQEGFFDDELVRLLERLAEMVGHALDELDLKHALRAERQAQHQIARRDELTTLPNRLDFAEHVAAALSRAAGTPSQFAIIKLDLDDFRLVNERFGRPAGDFLLNAVAARLTALLAAPDFVARNGGDAFAILLESERELQDLPKFLARLHGVLCQPVILPNGETVELTFRAGITTYPRDHGDADQLLRHAEMALFAAKSTQGAFPFWRHYQDIVAGEKEPLFARALLSQGALRVHYQPVVDLASGKVVSVEALARMEENGALLPPAQFLHDMLPADRAHLFRQVLTTAINQLRAWDEAGLTLAVSVNIDAQVLLLEDTIPFLHQALTQANLAPARLCLELLETHDFIDLRRARHQIEAARALGIRTALDDLGTGYSSMLKIRELPLDLVKLDRAFIAGLRQQPDDLLFVAMIQTLTASRGMGLIVEGVETEDVLDALNMLGVRHAQGFLFARPMPPEALTSWLGTRRFPQSSAPKTLLGAYAVHLSWLRAFDASRSQAALLAYLHGEDSYSLEPFFRTNGMAGSKLHHAYKRFQSVIRGDSANRPEITKAAGHFRTRLMAALKAE